MIGDAINVRAPFDVAFIFFLISSVYARTALPYISPESMSDAKKPGQQQGVSGFFAPLRILLPQRLRLADGRLRRHYGVLFLCSGIFIGVVRLYHILATRRVVVGRWLTCRMLARNGLRASAHPDIRHGPIRL